MSFRCGNNECNKVVNGKPVRVVLETRDHEHVEMRYNEKLDEVVPVVMGHGTQIVHEADMCAPCAAAAGPSAE